MILPCGVVSKKDIGECMIRTSILLCNAYVIMIIFSVSVDM